MVTEAAVLGSPQKDPADLPRTGLFATRHRQALMPAGSANGSDAG